MPQRPIALASAATGILFLVAVASLALGAINLSLVDVWQGLTSDSTDFSHTVVWEIRLPRLLDAMVAGAALAVAGALIQDATRNPLADPTLLGITPAAGLVGAAVAVWYPESPQWTLALASVAGGLAGAGIMLAAASRGDDSPVQLVLIGVGLSAFLSAIIVALLSSSRTFLQTSLGFLAGGLYGAEWKELNTAGPYAVVALVGAVVLAGRLNVLVLGDDVARGLGVNPGRTRTAALVLCGILTGAAVAIAGLVSFVGLVCPHIARFLGGNDNRLVIPLTGLVGAVLVASADLVARLIIRPSEIPMGIFTAIIGAPFLVYLVRRRA